MSGKGTGSTSFEDMSHEQMLSWLDQADAGTVRAAAHRLTAAAKEIRKIAEELKIRPQWVEWKGEGADAFRTWTGDLANATLRLGDFGADSATWLGHASDAIAQAQVSIPRDRAGARANLDAATAAHNDPDAATVSHRSTTELAALAADKEKVRQEAAAQMTKLGQAYRWSATQLDGLERPRFPPPPKAIQPEPDSIWSNVVVSRGGGGTERSPSGHTGPASLSFEVPKAADEATGHGGGTREESGALGAVERSRSETPDHVSVQIDGTPTLPQTRSAPPVSPVGPPSAGSEAGVGPLSVETIQSMPSGAPGARVRTTGPERASARGRSPMQPGREPAVPVSSGARSVGGGAEPGRPAGMAGPRAGGGPAAPPGHGTGVATPGQLPGRSGITGGRPTSTTARQNGVRPAQGLPRGTVVGGTPAATGRGAGGPKPPTLGLRQGGRGPSEPGGAGTGWDSGVVGGRPRAQKRPGAGAFTRGGSGLVRHQDSDDVTLAEEQQTGQRSGRPETWLPEDDRPCT
ncbi:translation initiation factor IF-2 [Streptomyces sp. NPDC088736]|uniref:translation initiation factor IF-2 n=1 Tax=Streptomyces sp. NPDC088736 TaxID=3365881 RepID=UPI0037F5976E